MNVTRRDFLRLASAGAAATATAAAGAADAEAKTGKFRLEGTSTTATICPFCSVGCGMSVHAANGDVVDISGDPSHPISRGTLCPKGASARQLRANPKRVTRPLYRAPGAADWKEVSWDWALGEIAKRVKKTRDGTFEATDKDGLVVNRTLGMASVGSAALDNEECYLYQKLLRGLGLVYIEHQARL
jgi:formate dehydrogenase major subunit